MIWSLRWEVGIEKGCGKSTNGALHCQACVLNMEQVNVLDPNGEDSILILDFFFDFSY